MYNHGYLISGL